MRGDVDGLYGTWHLTTVRKEDRDGGKGRNKYT
jgi:hypothetical protein